MSPITNTVQSALFQAGCANLGSDQLEATAHNGTIAVTVEQPWAGDSETGFGRSCSINISAEQAAQFAAWLMHHAKEIKGT